MVYFVAILLGVLAYVILKFLFTKVESLASIAEILALIGGVLVTLLYAGAIG